MTDALSRPPPDPFKKTVFHKNHFSTEEIDIKQWKKPQTGQAPIIEIAKGTFSSPSTILPPSSNLRTHRVSFPSTQESKDVLSKIEKLTVPLRLFFTLTFASSFASTNYNNLINKEACTDVQKLTLLNSLISLDHKIRTFSAPVPRSELGSKLEEINREMRPSTDRTGLGEKVSLGLDNLKHNEIIKTQNKLICTSLKHCFKSFRLEKDFLNTLENELNKADPSGQRSKDRDSIINFIKEFKETTPSNEANLLKKLYNLDSINKSSILTTIKNTLNAPILQKKLSQDQIDPLCESIESMTKLDSTHREQKEEIKSLLSGLSQRGVKALNDIINQLTPNFPMPESVLKAVRRAMPSPEDYNKIKNLIADNSNLQLKISQEILIFSELKKILELKQELIESGLDVSSEDEENSISEAIQELNNFSTISSTINDHTQDPMLRKCLWRKYINGPQTKQCFDSNLKDIPSICKNCTPRNTNDNDSSKLEILTYLQVSLSSGRDILSKETLSLISNSIAQTESAEKLKTLIDDYNANPLPLNHPLLKFPEFIKSQLKLNNDTDSLFRLILHVSHDFIKMLKKKDIQVNQKEMNSLLSQMNKNLEDSTLISSNTFNNNDKRIKEQIIQSLEKLKKVQAPAVEKLMENSVPAKKEAPDKTEKFFESLVPSFLLDDSSIGALRLAMNAPGVRAQLEKLPQGEVSRDEQKSNMREIGEIFKIMLIGDLTAKEKTQINYALVSITNQINESNSVSKTRHTDLSVNDDAAKDVRLLQALIPIFEPSTRILEALKIAMKEPYIKDQVQKLKQSNLSKDDQLANISSLIRLLGIGLVNKNVEEKTTLKTALDELKILKEVVKLNTTPLIASGLITVQSLLEPSYALSSTTLEILSQAMNITEVKQDLDMLFEHINSTPPASKEQILRDLSAIIEWGAFENSKKIEGNKAQAYQDYAPAFHEIKEKQEHLFKRTFKEATSKIQKMYGEIQTFIGEEFDLDSDTKLVILYLLKNENIYTAFKNSLDDARQQKNMNASSIDKDEMISASHSFQNIKMVIMDHSKEPYNRLGNNFINILAYKSGMDINAQWFADDLMRSIESDEDILKSGESSGLGRHIINISKFPRFAFAPKSLHAKLKPGYVSGQGMFHKTEWSATEDKKKLTLSLEILAPKRDGGVLYVKLEETIDLTDLGELNDDQRKGVMLFIKACTDAGNSTELNNALMNRYENPLSEKNPTLQSKLEYLVPLFKGITDKKQQREICTKLMKISDQFNLNMSNQLVDALANLGVPKKT